MSHTGIASPYSWDSPFHYSQATVHNGVVYVSGQAALGAHGPDAGAFIAAFSSDFGGSIQNPGAGQLPVGSPLAPIGRAFTCHSASLPLTL